MDKPLVSIIIRTCGRPQILKKALESVKEQSYLNLEIIVVEDGKNYSESFITENYSDLNIQYYATGKQEGRCRIGNIGMSQAKGKYLNFLDDDDYLLPNHVETLVARLEETGYSAAYAIAEEHQIKQMSEKYNGFKIKRRLIRYRQPYNKLLLCYMNYIPIQSIMFRKTLFEQYGGLDESLEVLEDWDLWVRYSAHSDFVFVPVVTSVYHTPYKGKSKHKREVQMHNKMETVIQKHAQYQIQLSAESINRDMDYILNVFNKKSLLFYLQKVRNYLLYRDI